MSTLPTSVQDVANAIFSMYGATAVPVPSMVARQTWTDNNHQKIYLLSATGSFRQSFKDAVATKISFSVLADASKAWALVATDKQGKTVWEQNSFIGKPVSLHYAGSGQLWRGTFDVTGVKLTNREGVQVNSWQWDQFRVSYIGPGNPKVASVRYRLKDSVGGDTGTDQNVYLKSGNFKGDGGGNGIFPSPNELPKVSVEWDGHRETFLLHSVTQ